MVNSKSAVKALVPADVVNQIPICLTLFMRVATPMQSYVTVSFLSAVSKKQEELVALSAFSFCMVRDSNSSTQGSGRTLPDAGSTAATPYDVPAGTSATNLPTRTIKGYYVMTNSKKQRNFR